MRLWPTELTMTVRGRLYRKFSDFNYVELRPEATYVLGRTELFVSYLFTPRQLLFTEEDPLAGEQGVFFREHAVAAGIGHKFTASKRLRVKLSFEGAWDDYRPPESERNSSTGGVSGVVRYHFTPLFVPLGGVEYATRDARRANHDRDRIDVKTGFDTRLPRGFGLRFRYERSWRDYTVSTERDGEGRRNRNFGREEDIQQYQTWLTVPVPALPQASLRLRYEFREGARDSAPGAPPFRPIGDVHELGLEVSYTLP